MLRPYALLLLLSFAGGPALAQQRADAPVTTGRDIVVTGVRLKDAQAALDACLAQHCPPDKDIDATLGVAEIQFVAGNYKDARTVMLKSIGRNRRFAKNYPVAVSDLFRANSRVAVHLGEESAYRSGALDVLSALKAGLPETDARVLGAQLELGDSFAKTGRIDEAVRLYHSTAKRAHALALPTSEGYALLRVAMVYAALSTQRNDGYYEEALRSTDALISNRDPALAAFVQAAKLLRANIAVKHGDPGAVDRLIAEYRSAGAGSGKPVLLYAPSIKQRQLSGREGASGETLNQLAVDDFENQWVDVSFLIGPDGRVTDADVLRKSQHLSGDWVKPIVTAVSGRRYAPLPASGPGVLRVERYTFTAAWTTVTGTRLRVRSPVPRIEVVDLSRDAPMPGQPSGEQPSS